MAMKSALSEYYNKGEVNVKEKDPKQEFKNIPTDTIVVRVKRGSKVPNIMGFVEKSFKDEENRHMIFSGCGDAIEKTITCVEITKSTFQELHQITKLSSLRVEEYWEPTKEDLDRLQVTREIPIVSILLCKDTLDSSEPGYQCPGKSSNSKKRKKTTNTEEPKATVKKESTVKGIPEPD